ncbi:MAG: FGGY family carbohydrate kinase [Firmicutes bacterium]|nr:FGGY family carbohydrate kinase [Bacillota bacterium]MDH7494822.1 FGGY family carbohydrate kinase [Bacillota bacterium]
MGSKDYVLTIDIGTETGRAALVDPSGSCVRIVSVPYEVDCPKPNWVQQDPEMWWTSTCHNIQQLLKECEVDPASIACVAACGQMHAPVSLAKDGSLVPGPVPLWCDKRTADLCKQIRASNDEVALARLAGNPVCPSWTGLKMAWLRENSPAVYERTWKFLTCKDFINYKLTGEVATDYSEASGTFLMDAERKAWSVELCDVLDVDIGKLPPILPADHVVGTVTREAGRQTGLAEGTPVVTCGGDMMCILLGAGVAVHGVACDVTGTAADISVFCPSPVTDIRLMNLHHVAPGWIAFGILDAGGGSLKWFKDEFCQEERREAQECGVSVYEVMSKKASAVGPCSEGVVFLPYLLGERTLGTPNARGVIFGLTTRHTKAHVIRAIMEGVNFDLRQSLEIIEESGVSVREIRATAGGARSSVWCQIKADIYKKPIVALEETEGGIMGGAILASTGAGLYESVEEAASAMVKRGQTYLPSPSSVVRYDEGYRVFKSLHDALQDKFDAAARVFAG